MIESAGTPLGLQRPQALPVQPPAGSSQAELEGAAREFEAYLIRMLFEQMQSSVQSGGLFGHESLQGYNALVQDGLARRAAETGRFGIARQLLAQWEGER